MRLVVIESPFAGDVERNLDYLRHCILDCLQRGEAPYASHGLYPIEAGGPLVDSEPDEREWGIKAGFAWRRAADATVVYRDLGVSDGMKYGIEHALEHGRTVEYRTLGGIWIRHG